MPHFINLHCDTLSHCVSLGAEHNLRENSLSVDFTRMAHSGCAAQFFSIFPWPEEFDARCESEALTRWQWVERSLERMREALADSSDLVAQARSARELEKNLVRGVPSVFLTLEGADPVEGEFGRLQKLYEAGVRLVTLTWNYPNCMGFPHSADKTQMARGLTEFGKETVSFLSERHMLIDVSHLSDGGFWDVLELSNTPVVASHSNARALSPHTRNLSDDMLRALGNAGGVAGLNFYGPFLGGDGKNMRSRIADMARHARHMANVGGMECVALGSDFDGIEGDLELSGIEQMEKLFDALSQAGFSEEEIDKIAFGNAKRIIYEVLRDERFVSDKIAKPL